MSELKKNIQAIIDKFDLIMATEGNQVYPKIKQQYLNAINSLDSKGSIQNLKDEVAITIRLFMEAPPANKELGMDTLMTMDKFYKKINTLS